MQEYKYDKWTSPIPWVVCTTFLGERHYRVYRDYHAAKQGYDAAKAQKGYSNVVLARIEAQTFKGEDV